MGKNEQTPATGSGLSMKRRPDFSSVTVILLTAVLFAVIGMASKTFLTYSNIYSILYGVAFQFLAAIGFTYLMIMGEIDLSVGSVYAFAGMFTGYLMLKKHLPLAPSIIISLAVCLLLGLLTGFLVVRLRLNSMMVTIATMTLVRGLASNFVKALTGATYPTKMRALAKASFHGLHYIVIVMIVLVVVLEYLLRNAAFFKKMYYVGENLETTRIYGIRSDIIKTLMFGVSALCAGIGGILINARVTYADTTIGNGLEFTVLTAAVLGGASLSGGKGSILATAFGLIFLAAISNTMVVFNIDPLLSQLIVGIILIVSVFIDSRVNKNS